MRRIRYQRHEFRYEPENRRAPFITFVYDVPYLDGCGVFPPLHILNQILESGGSQGGMGPGATWDPFCLTPEEYEELVAAVEETDLLSLQSSARYVQAKFTFDPELDHIQDRFAWLRAACEKYQTEYLEQFEN